MAQQEQDIRVAAETLLTGSLSSYQHNPSASHLNYSLNSPEDLITGCRQGGRMSVVRRFFCLFVTFDLLFTVLMWLVCIMLSGDDVASALSKQIVHYNIHESLFDIVMAAACRFVVLLLFYALLYINHWCIIALSTAATCAFLIAKVFVFDWPTAQSPVFQVLLILISFVLAWGEAWFLDSRVLPQESHASHFLQGSSLGPDCERAPLLRNFLQGLPRYDEHQESVRNFYSPMESPRDSDDEGEGVTEKSAGRGDHTRPPENQEAEYRCKAQEVLETAWRLLNSPDWRLEKTTAQGDTIHSKQVPRASKLYRLTGIVELAPRQLLELLHHRIEDAPSWNPTLLQCRRVQILDEHTDVLYQVVAEAAGGVVASRDFVNLRRWGLVDGCYVTAAAAVSHASHPPHRKYIRGENGPCCWAMRPLEGQPVRCSVQWLLNTSLRGWLPQPVVDSALSVAMCEYMGHLRTHAKSLNQ